VEVGHNENEHIVRPARRVWTAMSTLVGRASRMWLKKILLVPCRHFYFFLLTFFII